MPKCDFITSTMLFREAYETGYTIFNHEEPQHPWDLVLVREKEDIYTNGVMATFIKRYRTRKVNERFGLSLTDVLRLPKHAVEMIFKECDDINQAEIKAYQNVEENLNAEKQKQKNR